MKTEINARGLSQIEIQSAIDRAVEFKHMNPAELEAKLQKLMVECDYLIEKAKEFEEGDRG